VQKTYIARVLGSFPDDPIALDRQLAWDSGSNHAFLMEPDGSLSHKQSMGRVPEVGQNQKLQAKEAQTGFRLLSVAPDARTSLVECQPKTGRTHQIRSVFGFTCLVGHVTANLLTSKIGTTSGALTRGASAAGVLLACATTMNGQSVHAVFIPSRRCCVWMCNDKLRDFVQGSSFFSWTPCC
jgi:hypothetical protein